MTSFERGWRVWGGGLGVRWINSERALVVEINWGKHRCFINSKNYAQHSNIFLLIGVWKWVMIFWPNPTHYHCFFFWPNQTQPILNFSENDPNQPDPFWLKKFWPKPTQKRPKPIPQWVNPTRFQSCWKYQNRVKKLVLWPEFDIYCYLCLNQNEFLTWSLAQFWFFLK